MFMWIWKEGMLKSKGERIMKTYDKKWAIQQMLDGKKVLQGESTILRYCHGEFYQVAGDCMGAVEINSLPKGGYTLYEEPEKVELPEPKIYNAFTKSPENDFLEDDYQDRLGDEVHENRKYINQIIKNLKAKENRND